MDRTEAIAWVLSMCAHSLRLSQAKTLSELVAAAVGVGRLSLANLGRSMDSAAGCKHRIKRAWRFIANRRVEPAVAMRGPVARLLKRWKPGKPLVVTLDWTKVRRFHTLMAAAVVKGRAAPLVWGSYSDRIAGRSQNSLERGLLHLLRAMVPAHVPIIVLADRGFGRTELGRFCQRIGLDYVIRIRGDVWVRCDGYAGRLDRYPIRRGSSRLLKHVQYRQERSLTQHVVVRWKRGLRGEADQPWFLMSNLDRSAVSLSNLYGRRFDIEQFFRDLKNKRQGWALRDTQITRPDRLDRLLLIVALAYWLLLGLGLWARKHHPARRWSSNSRPHDASAFTIGRWMLDQLRLKPKTLATALRHACEQTPNWG